jgi:RecA/RadA recombinase
MKRKRSRKGTSTKSVVKQIKEHAFKREEISHLNYKMMVPTGSTLLNLALSDMWNGGWMLGKMANIIGDKGTGKSFLAHSTLAEAATKKRFAEYVLKHDDVEAAIEYNIKYLFGNKLAKRLEVVRSKTVGDFRVNIWDMVQAEQPFVYIEDSFDALTSDEEIERMVAESKKKKSGGTARSKGSWKTEKVRGFSEMLRLMIQGMAETSSLLLIISQVRENLTNMPFQPRYRRTGGKALEHNETHEVWLASTGKLRKTKGGPIIGMNCKVNVTKNRVTGKQRSVTFPLYYDYGIDDIGSMVDWLVSEDSGKYWKKKGGVIQAKELGRDAKPNTLIKEIEEAGLEKDLRLIAQKAWDKVEANLKLDRKRKYE